jgi:excisionase family DNA binding protein
MTIPATQLIPRGTIRVSEAFERLYRTIAPEWADLEELCVRWDEAEEANNERPCEANPYAIIDDAKDEAEQLLRHALHNVETGVDLQLPRKGWWKFGDYPGIRRDVTGDHFPGPSCEIDGVPHPIFLDTDEFDRWLSGSRIVETARSADRHSDDGDTQMLSIPDVVRESGISRSRIYDAFSDGSLQSVKYGRRTLVRKSELDRFLRGLAPQR